MPSVGTIISVFVAATAALLAVGLVWRWVSRIWSVPCPSWMIRGLENPYVRRFAGSERILDLMDLSPGMLVLDVGCGPGRIALPAALRVGANGQVVALDIQQAMLSTLRQRVQRLSLSNVSAIRATIDHCPLRSGTFDRAMMVTVLGEVPDRQAAIRAIFSVLKPGGRFSVTELIPDPHYQSRRKVMMLCESVGFASAQTESRGMSFTINFVKPTGRAGKE